jgi:hypothetical protein
MSSRGVYWVEYIFQLKTRRFSSESRIDPLILNNTRTELRMSKGSIIRCEASMVVNTLNGSSMLSDKNSTTRLDLGKYVANFLDTTSLFNQGD